jgi:hypothetical protein
MPITIGKHVFDGPYKTTKELTKDPGIFAVVVAKGEIGSLIEIGESNNVVECVENHPDRSRWHRFSSGGVLCYAVLYTPILSQAERHSIEQEIREFYSERQ